MINFKIFLVYTKSISNLCSKAERSTHLPMRPKPLIPTFTAIFASDKLPLWASNCSMLYGIILNQYCQIKKLKIS